jgi:hypothetical protein
MKLRSQRPWHMQGVAGHPGLREVETKNNNKKKMED